jgi:hypothetical protein
MLYKGQEPDGSILPKISASSLSNTATPNQSFVLQQISFSKDVTNVQIT